MGRLYIAPQGADPDDPGAWTCLGETDDGGVRIEAGTFAPGDRIRHGPRTWYLAECQDCMPVLPQPFSDPGERTDWIVAHRRATGHRVTCREETR